MKYRMNAVAVENKGFEVPDGAPIVGIIPNYETNKWLIAFLVPVKEKSKVVEDAAEEASKDD